MASGGHILQGPQQLAPSVLSSPAPPSSPQTAWPGMLFIFTMDGLLFGRQSKPRNGVRLSLVYFSLTLRILSLANPPPWFTTAGHDRKSHSPPKKGQSFSPTPSNCQEVISYLQMQIHCLRSTGPKQGGQR